MARPWSVTACPQVPNPADPQEAGGVTVADVADAAGRPDARTGVAATSAAASCRAGRWERRMAVLNATSGGPGARAARTVDPRRVGGKGADRGARAASGSSLAQTRRVGQIPRVTTARTVASA